MKLIQLLTKGILEYHYLILRKPIRKISNEFKIPLTSINRKLKNFNIESRKPFEIGKPRSIEVRQKISNSSKGKKRSERSRKKQSFSMMGSKNHFYNKQHKKESIQKIKQNMPNFSGENNPMYGVSLSGKLSPHWQGGKSFEIYPQEFKQIKKFILERDNYTCQNLNCMNTKDLCIHHLDYNKKNNNPENLVTLCRSCHAKTNGKNKRQYYTEFYQNIMMNRILECLL